MKTRNIILLSVLVGLIIAVTLSTIMAQTPLQPYKELGSKGDIEFRYYPEACMATVQNPDTTFKGSSSKNFRTLAGYIFGGNKEQTKIAMTSPVHMNWNEGKSEMSFVMPEGYDLKNLPTPLSQEINLHVSSEEYLAALRFGGYASDTKIEEKKAELLALLASMNVKPTQAVRFLGYNAPWDFMFRRNEVVVSITKEEAERLTTIQ